MAVSPSCLQMILSVEMVPMLLIVNTVSLSLHFLLLEFV